jgi:integrase
VNFEKLFNMYSKSPGFRRLSSRSKQIYVNCAETLIKYFGTANVTKLKRSDMIKFQSEHSATPAHANLVLRVASVVFGYGLDIDAVQFNPVSRMKMLPIGSHVKWTPEEVRRVIALGDRQISTAVALAWYTGQRESDVLAMRWRDYDGEYITLRQQKTSLEMKIKAHPDLVAYLNPLRGPDDHFIVSGPQKMSGQAFRNMLKRRTDKLHIEKVFHGIRKGVASSLAEGGSSIKEIAAILGHKSIRMAAYYADQADSKMLVDSAVNNLASVS